MENGITVAEVRELKKQAESEMEDIVFQFWKKSGLNFSEMTLSFDYNKEYCIDGRMVMIIYPRIKTKIEF